ncbi:MAG TPA: hypothetical protein VMV44_15595 [Rectinemataceae bacterium]|nr:hypothetical protein [Rectinemataceae bacterium]
MKKNRSNILAARVEPWQLFRFEKYVEWRQQRPGMVLQEILQVFFGTAGLPDGLMEKWLDEYHGQEGVGR